MIVYVETNFLLEIILGQEELSHANQILDLARDGVITLRFPSFSLMEPLWTVRSRGKERGNISTSLNKELDQLSRSAYNAEIVWLIKSVTEKINSVENVEMDKLTDTFLQTLRIATPIQISEEVYKKSLDYRSAYSLSHQDAIVYSSIIVDLEQQHPETAKLFVSKNSRDFNQSNLKEELQRYNCKYIAKFEQSIDYIQSRLA